MRAFRCVTLPDNSERLVADLSIVCRDANGDSSYKALMCVTVDARSATDRDVAMDAILDAQTNCGPSLIII